MGHAVPFIPEKEELDHELSKSDSLAHDPKHGGAFVSLDDADRKAMSRKVLWKLDTRYFHPFN